MNLQNERDEVMHDVMSMNGQAGFGGGGCQAMAWDVDGWREEGGGEGSCG